MKEDHSHHAHSHPDGIRHVEDEVADRGEHKAESIPNPTPSEGHAEGVAKAGMLMDSAAHAAHDGGAHAQHVDHSGHEDLFRRKFWVSLLLSIPVLLYSEMVQMLLGFRVPAFPGSQWVEPLFGVLVFLYGGIPFIQMAVPEIRSRAPGMMTLIRWLSRWRLATAWRPSSCPARQASSGSWSP